MSVNNYYVATTGSNSNDGLSASTPWQTLSHADSNAALGSNGTVIHVAPGSYNVAELSTSKSGTGSGARVRWQSDVPHGAKLNYTGGAGGDAWLPHGNYVQFVGFELAGNNLGATAFDLLGNHQDVLGCYIHDFNGGGCQPTGAILENGNAGATTGGTISGNKIINIGPLSGCNEQHGIYLSFNGTVCTNNIIGRISTFGIQLHGSCCNDIISNNTLFHCGKAGIIVDHGVSYGGCTVSDFITITNNIIANSGGAFAGHSGGITLGNVNGSVAPCSDDSVGTHIVVSNNLIYGCTTPYDLCSAYIKPAIIDGSDAIFVNYDASGHGDYHLAVGASAISNGTSTGAPSTDYDGLPRNPNREDIGAYVFTDIIDTPPPPPTGNVARVSQVVIEVVGSGISVPGGISGGGTGGSGGSGGSGGGTGGTGSEGASPVHVSQIIGEAIISSNAIGISTLPCAPTCGVLQQASGLGAASFPVPVKSGSTVIVGLAVNNNTTTLSGVHDDKNNHYTSADADSATSQSKAAIFYGVSIAGGPVIDANTGAVTHGDNGGPGTGLAAGSYVIRLAIDHDPGTGTIWSNIVEWDLTVPSNLDGTDWWEIDYTNPDGTTNSWGGEAWVSFNGGAFQHVFGSDGGYHTGVYLDGFAEYENLSAFPFPTSTVAQPFVSGLSTVTADYTGAVPWVWLVEIATPNAVGVLDRATRMQPGDGGYSGPTTQPEGTLVSCGTNDLCVSICAVGGDGGTITGVDAPWTLGAVQGGNALALRFATSSEPVVPTFANATSTDFAISQAYFSAEQCVPLAATNRVAVRAHSLSPTFAGGVVHNWLVSGQDVPTEFAINGSFEPDRITCPVSGHYLIGAACETVSHGGGINLGYQDSPVTYSLLVNGAPVKQSNDTADIMQEIDLNVGDYIGVGATSGEGFFLWMIQLEKTLAQIDADPTLHDDYVGPDEGFILNGANILPESGDYRLLTLNPNNYLVMRDPNCVYLVTGYISVFGDCPPVGGNLVTIALNAAVGADQILNSSPSGQVGSPLTSIKTLTIPGPTHISITKQFAVTLGSFGDTGTLRSALIFNAGFEEGAFSNDTALAFLGSFRVRKIFKQFQDSGTDASAPNPVNCGCGGGGIPGALGDCYGRTPSSVWEASVTNTEIPNDGSYSLMLRLKDNQDLTNVDPNGDITSPWYSKCILSALAPCSSPNFMKFGGFWNWIFQNKNPNLLFVLKVGIIFFNNDYTILQENVWQFGDPVNGTNAWVQLPPDQIVISVPAGAAFFRYECLGMVAVIPNGGVPLAVNTGVGNNYATFLFDSLYAIQQTAGAQTLPPTGTGSCTGSSGGTTGGGTGGGQGTGGSGDSGGSGGSGGTGGTGGGTGGSGGTGGPGGGGNPSGTATVVSTAGTLSYKAVSSLSGSGPHNVLITWDTDVSSPDPVTSYNIYRGQAVGTETLLASVDAPTTTYTDITAVATVQYFYYVTAVNVDGESGHLPDVSINVPSPGGFIEWTWHGVTVFWSDGTTSAPPDGTITQTGLLDGLLFYYFPYYDFQSNTVQWLTGGSGDSPAIAFVASTPAEIASQSLTGRVPLFPNLSAGTSGGPPGGGF